MNRLHRLDVLISWFKEYMGVIGYRPRTILNYSCELLSFRSFLFENTDCPDVDDITPPLLHSYAAHLYSKGIKAQSVHTKLEAIKSFFHSAYAEKKIYVDLSGHIQVPAVKKQLPSDILSEAEIKQIFDYVELLTDNLQVKTKDDALLLRDRAIFEVLYSTGIRRNELTALKLSDINYSTGLLQIRQGKGGKDRVVPIGSTALDVIYRYICEARPLLATAKTGDFLFVNQVNGRKFNDNVIRASIMHVTEGAGLKKHVRVHSVRHTCATHMLNNGADIRYVQELLGHSSIASTQIYTHVSIKKLKETHAQYHPREKGEL